jgi:hypothetical protein
MVANPARVGGDSLGGCDRLRPGSFYTSILPHLLVDGALAAIGANRRAPRIFIGNILECAETRGATLSDAAGPILPQRHGGVSGIDRPLTHVFNDEMVAEFLESEADPAGSVLSGRGRAARCREARLATFRRWFLQVRRAS